MAVDEEKLNAFMGRFVGDLGAVMHAATVVVGDQLGLYKALAEQPASADELARRTETDPRYLLEWLSCQAASGYVQYDPTTATFSLSDEQAFALAMEGSPAFIPGAFQIAVAQFKQIGRCFFDRTIGDYILCRPDLPSWPSSFFLDVKRRHVLPHRLERAKFIQIARQSPDIRLCMWKTFAGLIQSIEQGPLTLGTTQLDQHLLYQ